MSTGIGSLGFVTTTQRVTPAAARAATPAAAAAAQPSAGSVELALPLSVPPEASAAVEAAAARAEALAERNRQLHFELDEHSGRVVIEVRDLDGNILRTIPPSKAIDIMTSDRRFD